LVIPDKPSIFVASLTWFQCITCAIGLVENSHQAAAACDCCENGKRKGSPCFTCHKVVQQS